MVFSQKEVDVVSDAWNMADGWIKLKVLMHFVVCDKLILIAQFGAESIEESIYLDEPLKVRARIEGLTRLITQTRLIFAGSKFALKKAGKEEIESFKKRIDEVEKLLSGIQKRTGDIRTNAEGIEINEEHFNLSLKELRDILEELATPLNASGLIFPTSDETDLDKIKDELIFGG